MVGLYNMVMTKNTEDTILSFLRSMDKRLDKIDKTLAAHSRLHRKHQEKFQQIFDAMAPVMEAQTEHGITLEDHEERLIMLEAA